MSKESELELSRRRALSLVVAGVGVNACSRAEGPKGGPASLVAPARSLWSTTNPVLQASPLPAGSTWETLDPFLFCAHHDDHYPPGNGAFGPRVSLAGRALGQDFSGRDGFSMYHGLSVPGFPQHPHRGFETVTVVRRGLLDHSDSLGAAARFGEGDLQWLTAGAGIQHAEMFPLLGQASANPLELFQIWLNLPQKNKMVAPYFSMFWSKDVPTRTFLDTRGRPCEVSLRAGDLEDMRAPTSPPHSWAKDPGNAVCIWTIKLGPGASWELPGALAGLNRSLYFFRGQSLTLNGVVAPTRHRLDLRSELRVRLENGPEESELLLLQGRPIREPIARRGPFVMNTDEEIRAAYYDYQATQFGGWPWPSEAPVHGGERQRFARHPDGRVERPG
ncbi:MAG: pirin family protein [Polyangiaceae bacterium]|nr:pirin family protein [Polyangiaceae bacterium]